MRETIRIGEKLIGSSETVYVIAEMACAHDGDVDKAKGLINAAVSAKADAIQLQFFSRKDLMTPSHEAYNLLGTLEFSRQEWKEIYQYARRKDIQIFACAYDVPSAELAIQLGVDGIKLNSSDLSNPDLLEIVARSGLPYTMGTGASTVEEIAQAVETCLRNGGDQIILMHGVQNFPTAIEHAQINRIRMLKALFPFPVGYQDHTDASHPFSRVVDLLAVGAGACVIEKHITLDRSETGTDYQAALEPMELKEFVQTIKRAERAMGSNRILPLSQNEKNYRKFQKKSIVSGCEIKKGQLVTRGMLQFMRSEPGLSPHQVGKIVGRATKRNIRQFENILPEDLE
jgi:sialic acid synthase SpsE